MYLKEYLHQDCQRLSSTLLLEDIRSTITQVEWSKRETAKEFRSKLLVELAELGWSDRVRIDSRSNINITSVMHGTGLCVQTGNMSRFYADLLKLETLHRNNLIHSAIYIIPLKHWASEIGSNIANYERFIEELEIFEATVTIPIVVFGIAGRI